MYVLKGEIFGLWPAGPTPVPLAVSTKCQSQQGFPEAQSWQEAFTTAGTEQPCACSQAHMLAHAHVHRG